MLPLAILLRLAHPGEDPDMVREVVVHQEADGQTASAQTVGRREIDTMPKRGAEDMLRHIPGMHIVQHGSQGKGYQFYLRGFDAVHGADVETHLGDVPLNELSNIHAHGYLDLAFIVPDAVKSVDATKGSYRLTQGNFGTAGSIRYNLGVPQRGTRSTYEFGSTLRNRLSLVHAPKKWGDETFVAVEGLIDRGYGERRRARRLSGIGQIELFDRCGTTVTAMAALYGARFELPGTVRLDEVRRGDVGLYDSYTHNSEGESGRAITSVTVKTHDDIVRSRTTAWMQARRFQLDENFTGDLLFNEGDRHLQRHEALSPGLTSEIGFRLHELVEMPVTARWQGDFARQHQDQLTDAGEVWDTPQNVPSMQQHVMSLGAGVRVFSRSWARVGFDVTAGGRVDAFITSIDDGEQQHTGSTVAFSPRFMSKLVPLERWQLFAAYGRGLRGPEARAFTTPVVDTADQDVSRYQGGRTRAVQSDSVEVGTRFQPSVLDFGVAGFGTWISRESIFDHVSGFNIERSATQRLGVDADMQVHPAPWMDIGADVTVSRGRFVDSGDPIPGAPPLVFATKVAVDHPKGWRGGIRWFVLGARPLSYGAKAAAATVLDLNVGYRYKWFQVDLSIDNLWNQQWREGEYHFASRWGDRPRSQIPTIHSVAGYPFMARLGITLHFDAMVR